MPASATEELVTYIFENFYGTIYLEQLIKRISKAYKKIKGRIWEYFKY